MNEFLLIFASISSAHSSAEARSEELSNQLVAARAREIQLGDDLKRSLETLI